MCPLRPTVRRGRADRIFLEYSLLQSNVVQFAPFPLHFIKPVVVNWAMDTWEGIVLRVGGVHHARLETRQAAHLIGNSSARLAVAGAPAGNGNLMLHLHLILARCERANPSYTNPISMSKIHV